MLAQMITFTGPQRSLTLFGVRLIGINVENAHKLLLTVGFIIAVLLFSSAMNFLLRLATRGLRRSAGPSGHARAFIS